MPAEVFAGIEAGGTKMICALASEEGVLAQTRLSTLAPDATFAAIAGFFKESIARYGRPRAGGIASFGPLDLDRSSVTYGSITTTPKPGWSSINMLERIANILDAPTEIDTDVNCAGMAEARMGAGRGIERICYVTVGTGIGVGCIENGRPLSGVGHPEAGHMRVSRATADEDFAGICPYHGDCLEGLACGPAMQARWRQDAEKLDDGHVAWEVEAHYLACLCVNLMYTVRPQRILLGGGVMGRASLYDRVRNRFRQMTAAYALDRWSADADSFICAPALVEPSPGLVGAFELARRVVTRGLDGDDAG